MNVEAQIHLNKFKPREYQLPILDALENKGYKRVIAVWPRRAGKDVVSFNLMIRAALKRVGVYYYIFPTYSQAKKVIWDSITNTGEKFIDYIPKQLIVSENSQEMKIKLLNGSLIQLVGSDNIDSLVGTNPRGIVFSEYALQNPRAYQFLRPILLANDGWALFESTPRGKNHFYEMYQIALNSPSWFVSKLTMYDTGHISLADIEQEKRENFMSEDLIQQEYFTSFDCGVDGAYYSKYIDKLRLNGQVGMVPWEPGFKVHTAWDLGFDDNMSIIFFQTIGTTVRIIDCYERNTEGLEHYIKVLASKPYVYGAHIAPHDIQVHELTTGMTRLEKAHDLGIDFTVADKVSIVDGIEAVRTTLPRCWFDEKNAADLLRALENHCKEWDQDKQVYKNKALHSKYSHFADAMRYLAVSLPKTRDGATAEDLNKRYMQAMYGNDSRLPFPFNGNSREM